MPPVSLSNTWPSVPHPYPAFPGEKLLACPACGSTNVDRNVRASGSVKYQTKSCMDCGAGQANPLPKPKLREAS